MLEDSVEGSVTPIVHCSLGSLLVDCAPRKVSVSIAAGAIANKWTLHTLHGPTVSGTRSVWPATVSVQVMVTFTCAVHCHRTVTTFVTDTQQAFQQALQQKQSLLDKTPAWARVQECGGQLAGERAAVPVNDARCSALNSTGLTKQQRPILLYAWPTPVNKLPLRCGHCVSGSFHFAPFAVVANKLACCLSSDCSVTGQVVVILADTTTEETNKAEPR